MSKGRVVTVLTVDGMQCEHCKRAVFTSLAGLSGIGHADVQLGTVTVEHDGLVTVDQLRDAIAVAGYTVTNATEQRRILPIASL